LTCTNFNSGGAVYWALVLVLHQFYQGKVCGLVVVVSQRVLCSGSTVKQENMSLEQAGKITLRGTQTPVFFLKNYVL
jgi:hypothetical protein